MVLLMIQAPKTNWLKIRIFPHFHFRSSFILIQFIKKEIQELHVILLSIRHHLVSLSLFIAFSDPKCLARIQVPWFRFVFILWSNISLINVTWRWRKFSQTPRIKDAWDKALFRPVCICCFNSFAASPKGIHDSASLCFQINRRLCLTSS